MAQAVPMFETALKALEREHKVETEEGCNVVHMLAKLNRDQGLIDKATPYFKRDLELRRRVYGSNAPEVASATYDFGFAKYIAQDYQGAAEKFIEASKIGDTKLQWAARNALAACYMQEGKEAEATKLFEESLASKPAGLEHPSITYTLGRLVRIFTEQKKFDYANRFLAQATAINQQFKQSDDADFREATVVYASRTSAR
jgi:tetratricopeptide (TPR) repeat protein